MNIYRSNKLLLALMVGAGLCSVVAHADKGKGGGGPLKTEPADIYTLSETIRNLNKPVQMAFNSLQAKIKKDSLNDAVSQTLIKIFREPQKLSNDLKKVVFVPKLEPCYDSEGNPVRASIYHMPENQVCMSVTLLAPELNTENYFTKLVSTGVHEESHRMDIMDEDRVAELQDRVEEIVQPKARNYERILQDNINEVSGLRNFMTKLNASIDQESQSEICARLANMTLGFDSFEHAHTVAQENGLGLLSPTDEARVSAIKTKIIFAAYYCSKAEENSEVYDHIFEKQNPLVWKSTYASSRFYVDVPEDIVLRKITYGSKTNLKLELDDVITQLSVVRESLQALSKLDLSTSAKGF